MKYLKASVLGLCFVLLLGAAVTIPSQLYFKANGTGAVLRLLYAKLADLPISVTDFAANGSSGAPVDPTGALDSAGGIQAAITAAGSNGGTILFPPGSYKVASQVTLASNITLIGSGRPQLTATVNGSVIFMGSAISNVTIQGLKFKGSSASTVPGGAGCGGIWDPANNGLITICNSTDLRITDNEFDTFYNGINVQSGTRAWIERNKITNWTKYGIVASATSDFTIDYNTIQGCLQAGGVTAYGITATGDQAGGATQFRSSISFNKIKDIPSWDGIMSHDVDGMQIIGNDIRNVRTGIDIGHGVQGNFISKIIVADNYIEGTTTDTWAGAAASAGGIVIAGFDATHQVNGATVTGNIVHGMFAATGMVSSGFGFGSIVGAHVDRMTITGNVIRAQGSVVAAAGVHVDLSTMNGLSITGNSMQGTMSQGGIRLFTVTSDVLTINSNMVQQVTATDPGIVITNSTITTLDLGDLATNSTTPFSHSGNTYALTPSTLGRSTTLVDLANVGDTRLILDTRTESGANVAADSSSVEFRRGGAAKWKAGLNFSGTNVDSFDFWSTVRVFGLTQGGVVADAGGFKHKRVAVGCTTAAAIGAACTSAALSWSTAFADANYTLVCTLTGPTGQPHISSVAQIAASFTVTIAADTAVGATGTIDCIAVHD